MAGGAIVWGPAIAVSNEEGDARDGAVCEDAIVDLAEEGPADAGATGLASRASF